ncbi:hypothetical protein MSTO_54370 [Mycobacterium stomatepiae]|uniref:Uncharacterized protein n=1 Tax=Mycobacterium stomatepiae TaxID=470076 RepID=A0A7I7QGB7_9MYCO|nr:hypothetical protein MSTO_54370 [Mycobacterium stomatepiae]
MVDGRSQRYHGVADRKPQAAPVRAIAHLLAPGNGARGQVAEDALGGEGGTHRQPKAHCPRRIRFGS